jgi:hypothetical protein
VVRCAVLGEEKATQDGILSVRDHALVLGEVEEIVPGNDDGQYGLSYADGRYRRVGAKISKHRE